MNGAPAWLSAWWRSPRQTYQSCDLDHRRGTTEAAIKLARKYTGRYEIIAFHGAAHGRTWGPCLWGSASAPPPGRRGSVPFLPGIVFAPFPYCYRCPFGRTPDNCRLHGTDYLDWLVETETEDNVAPSSWGDLPGRLGLHHGPGGVVPKLEAWCRRRDVLLIIDEVQASLGAPASCSASSTMGSPPTSLPGQGHLQLGAPGGTAIVGRAGSWTP